MAFPFYSLGELDPELQLFRSIQHTQKMSAQSEDRRLGDTRLSGTSTQYSSNGACVVTCGLRMKQMWAAEVHAGNRKIVCTQAQLCVTEILLRNFRWLSILNNHSNRHPAPTTMMRYNPAAKGNTKKVLSDTQTQGNHTIHHPSGKIIIYHGQTLSSYSRYRRRQGQLSILFQDRRMPPFRSMFTIAPQACLFADYPYQTHL